MNDDHVFRLVLIVGFVAVLPVGIYHRLKAATFEKLDRRQEGLFLLISIRLLGVVQLAAILTFLTDPTLLAWPSLSAGRIPTAWKEEETCAVHGGRFGPAAGCACTPPARGVPGPERRALRPPVTDSGTLPTLRWSFADSHVMMREGGWSRQTTRREIPASTDLDIRSTAL